MCAIVRWTELSLVLLFCTAVAFAETKGEILAKADALLDKADYRAACRMYAKAIEMDPNCAEAYYGRGTSLATVERL